MDTMITVGARHRGCFFCSRCLQLELPLTFAFWVFGDPCKALLQQKWHLAFLRRYFGTRDRVGRQQVETAPS